MKNRFYLLDTHVLLWLLTGKSDKFKGNNVSFLNEICYISVESLKEIALKIYHGKMDDVESNPKRLFRQIADLGISILDYDKGAVSALFNLPVSPSNTDPFDRSIIAHAISKKMVLVSKDEKFPFYQKHGLLLQRLK